MRQGIITVAIADREPAFRAGVRAALPTERFQVVAEAATPSQLFELAEARAADVALVDERDSLPIAVGGGGSPQTGVFTRNPTVAGLRKALSEGALGYVARDVDPKRLPLIIDDIAAGITSVPSLISAALLIEAAGRPAASAGALTARQEQVRALADDGLATAEIAAILGLSPVTVRRHLSDAQAKLRRAAAARNTVEGSILWNARRAS